jgi:hypothetical protein
MVSAPQNAPASDAAQVLRLFPVWLKQHLIGAVLTLAGLAGAIQTIIKVFGLSQAYLLPSLVAFFFFGIAFFCIWLISDPKQPIPQETEEGQDPATQPGTPPAPVPLFSRRVRFLAKLALPANVLIGAAIVYWLTPSIAHPVASVRTLIANIDSARQGMQNDSRAMALYNGYADARAAQGEGFWDHVTWAMKVQVSNVADHNQQLQTPIRGHLVPEELTTRSEAGRSVIDFKWVKDEKLASDLTMVVGHFLQADQESEKIDSLKYGNLSDYENAKIFNQDICRYWELVLVRKKTNLTDMDPVALEAAEQNVRTWLKREE